MYYSFEFHSVRAYVCMFLLYLMCIDIAFKRTYNLKSHKTIRQYHPTNILSI